MQTARKEGRYAGTMAPLSGTRKKSARVAARMASAAKKRVRIKPKMADLPVQQQAKVRQQNRAAAAKWRAKGGEKVEALQREKAANAYIKKSVIVSIVVIGRVAYSYLSFHSSLTLVCFLLACVFV